MCLHYIDHWAGVVSNEIKCQNKKVQNINVLNTDQTAIYSNFETAMATRYILD